VKPVHTTTLPPVAMKQPPTMTREWVEWYRNEHIKPHVTYNDG
jgi:hypothetical protein